MSFTPFRTQLVLDLPPTGTERHKSTTIQCLEACGRNLYIGGNDSSVRHFVLPQSVSKLGEGEYLQSSRSARQVKHLGSRGAVTQLGLVEELNQLLALWDGCVSVLHMFSLEPVVGMRRVRGITAFQAHRPADIPPGHAQLLTLGKRRRAVSIHTLTADTWERVREVQLPHSAVALAVDGSCLCVATEESYLLYDGTSDSILDLFPHDRSKQAIIVCKVENGEFLLNGPGSLGMSVTQTGISQRPPVQWPQNTLAAAVYFPYILALVSDALLIYSLADQQLKQRVTLKNGIGVLSTAEDAFVFTTTEVHILSPVPFKEQIGALVENKRLEEARELLQVVQKEFSKDAYKLLHREITCMAGFKKFYQRCFSEAKDLFIEGELDPRQLIQLYPQSSPLSTPNSPQLLMMPGAIDLPSLNKPENMTFQQYQDFLLSFLCTVRGTGHCQECWQDVDCTLLRLYAERGDHTELMQLLTSPNHCQLDICLPLLKKNQRFFALGLLFKSHGQDESAVKMWIQIVDGFYADDSYTNVFKYIVNFINQSNDPQLVRKFSDWVLQKNEEVGVHIFIGRKENEEFLPQDDILSFLTKYPTALIMYLEYLIKACKSKKEKHHTLLATAYVARILRAVDNGESEAITGEVIRVELQKFLQESSFYNVDEVKAQVGKTLLHLEKAILHGRIGEHQKVLQILVHEAKDHQGAEEYCRRISSGQSREFGHQHFLTLLKLYMESPHCETKVMDLFSKNSTAFDLVSVLHVLPGSWSVQLLSQFLSQSVRWTVHRRTMGWMEKVLVQAEYLRLKETWITATQGMIRVQKGQVCQRCGKSLTSTFQRSPKGELIHLLCPS